MNSCMGSEKWWLKVDDAKRREEGKRKVDRARELEEELRVGG